MRVESVDAPSLLELRAMVAQRLRACGAFEGCSAEDRRAILAQACLVIVHLTAGDEGRTMYLAHLAPSPGLADTSQGWISPRCCRRCMGLWTVPRT
jgi:hypothetical protein